MRKRTIKENGQSRICQFYLGNGRCGITKNYELICAKKRCTLFKERGAGYDSEGMAGQDKVYRRENKSS